MNAMETFVTDCTFINVGLCELQAIEESMDGVCLMCGQEGRGGWRRLCRGFWHMESSVKVGALEATWAPIFLHETAKKPHPSNSPYTDSHDCIYHGTRLFWACLKERLDQCLNYGIQDSI